MVKTALSTLGGHSVKKSHDKPRTESVEVRTEVVSSRESVIKYVVNKSEPLVSSLHISNKEASLLDTETLPFSVDQLLEFHKTSAQAAVKVFEETNEMAEPLSHDTKQRQSKKRKKEGTVEDRDKDIPAKKSAKSVKQSKKCKQVDDLKQELSGNIEDKLRFPTSFDSLRKADNDKCKKQKTSNKKPPAKNSPEPSYTLFQKTEMKCIEELEKQKISETLHTRDKSRSNNTDLQDQRLSNQLSFSNYTAAFPVNFVADNSVKSVTVSRATEPVLASSLTCETEYVVEQIKTCSESETDDNSTTLKSEPTRKRKKSRKVLENELLLEQELQEEEDKLKKKVKKSKTTEKKDSADNVDQGEQEKSGNESKKKKKSHKNNEESLSEDSERKRKMGKDAKKKKSKKTGKPDDVHIQATQLPTSDSDQKGKDVKKGEVPLDVKSQESKDSIDPGKAESEKGVDVSKSHTNKSGNVSKEKVKKEKKSKNKEAKSEDFKDKTTSEEEQEVKKDDSCKGIDKKDELRAIAAVEKKDRSHPDDMFAEEETGIAPKQHIISNDGKSILGNVPTLLLGTGSLNALSLHSLFTAYNMLHS